MDIKRLTQILFLDIETVSLTDSWENLPLRFKELWTHKAAYFIEKENLTAAEAYERKAGIYAEYGKIVVISLGYFTEQNGHLHLKVKATASHSEEDLLREFSNALLPRFKYLCAHNGKEFDFPYLSRRLLINDLPLPKILAIQGKKPWEINHYDTMDLWRFGDYKNYTSLDTLCAVFGIESSKHDMKGSEVSHVYYKENNLNRIAEYCNHDVVATAQVFLRLNQLPALKLEQIEIVP